MAFAAALLAAACATRDDRAAPGAAAGTTGVQSTVPVANTTPACPATGLWADCSVFQRIDRAGLAPRRDSSGGSVTEPPLTATGTLLHLSNAELEIYLYPDVGARERDEAKLERSRYLDYEAPVSMQTLPTLIHSANLIAILHSRNDHQRERVADALTAGPPQP